MSSNPFALLDEDTNTKPQKKVQQDAKKPAATTTATVGGGKGAQKTSPAATTATKGVQASKATTPGTQDKKPFDKKPMQKDRHTKGGRDAGEGSERKKFHDRSLSRHTKGQTERKGNHGWASKDAKADQVVADVEQKKQDAEQKKDDEAAAAATTTDDVKVDEVKVDEPQIFTVADALKSRQKVAGEKKNLRKATTTNVVSSTAINQGNVKQKQTFTTKPIAGKINPNKKQFSIDEFLVLQGGKDTSAPQFEYKKRVRKSYQESFPSL